MHHLSLWITLIECSNHIWIRFFMVFIDDIVIYYRTSQEHEEYMKTVLFVLQKNKLFAKVIKCEFWMSKVKFLGHVIS